MLFRFPPPAPSTRWSFPPLILRSPHARRPILPRWSRPLVVTALLLSVLTVSVGAPVAGQVLDEDADNSTARGFDLGSAGGEPGASGAAPANPGFGLASPLLVDPLFGSATTSVPIVVPPGRKNATPQLTLRYSSSAPNGPFGVGWDLSLGSIQRNTRQGVPVSQTSPYPYDDGYGFILTFPRGTVLLDRCYDAQAPALCTRWASQVEEIWVDAQFDRSANLWRVKDKSGVQYTFGGPPASRTGPDVNDDAGTFSWGLVRIEDPNMNRIVAQYSAPDLLSGANPYSYLDQIDYGGNTAGGFSDIFHVKVTYQTGRPDLPISYKGAFPVQVTRRAETIKVWADGGPFSVNNPSRTYRLSYLQDPDTATSQLRTVHLDVPGEMSPPDTTFTYESKPNGLDGEVDAVFDFLPTTNARAVLQHFERPSSGDRGPRVRSGFIDVNGDHLPDFLDGFGSGTAGLVLYLNKGNYRFERQNGGALWTELTYRLSFDSNAAGFVRLLDMTGDGLPDLVMLLPGQSVGTCTGAAGSPNTTCAWAVYPNDAGQLSTTALSWTGVPTLLRGEFPNPIQPTANANQQAQLIDLNGDALPDLIHCADWSATSPQCNFHRNTGTGFAAADVWDVPNIPPQWFDDPMNRTTKDPSVWDTLRWGPLAAKVGDGFATQGGASSGCYFPNVSFAFHLLKTIVDINGDGLPDLVVSGEPEYQCLLCSSNCCNLPACGSGRKSTYLNPNSYLPWQVAFNTGAGFADPVPWEGTENRLDPVYLDFTRYNNSGTTRMLQDVNGDALPDYVNFVDDNADWEVALNMGDSFAGDPLTRPTWSNIGSNTALVAKATAGGTYDGKTRSMPLDIDGDGITDRLTVVGSTSVFFRVRPGKPPRANLLRRIDNGVGGSWEASYSAAAEAGAQLPFPVWTVDSVIARSGLSGTGHALTTEYAFSGGYFDADARELRGFRYSTETRTADLRTTERTFAQPFAPGSTTATLPLSPFRLTTEEVRDASDRLLAKTTTQWGSVTIANTAGDRQRIRPQNTVRTVYGASTAAYSKQTRTFDLYDDYNNVRSVTVSGEVVRTSGTPEASTLSTTAITYSNDVAKAILDRPRTVVVTTSSGSTTTTHSSREYKYDANGNLTDILDWLDNDAINGGGNRWVTTMRFFYEGALDDAGDTGLPTKVETAWGDGEKATTTLRYACSQGLYPCTSTNEDFSHVTTRTYDLVHGRALSVTDPNLAVTSYRYDGFGRLLGVTEPLDPVDSANPTGPQREALKLTYVSGSATAPGYVKTETREPGNAAGYRASVDFFDGLGRHLERKSENEVNGVAETTVEDAVLFDSVGRVRRRLVPYPSTSTWTIYDPPVDASDATVFAYDDLDRVTATTDPDTINQTKTFYDIGGGIETHDQNYVACAANPSATNASCPGKRTIDRYDPFGRLVESDLYQGATKIRLTATTYDPLHRVRTTTTKDANNNTGNSQITYAYDSLGRRLTMVEKYSGTWDYVYDDAGNLVSQNDPRTGQHVEVCYDRLNRPTGESAVTNDTFSQAPCSQTANRGAYFYDGATNGKGRLWEALGPKTSIQQTTPITASTTTVLEYDKRGREVRVRKSLALMTGSSRSFTWQYAYNASDQITKVNYPTDTVDEDLFLFYNSVGRPRTAYTVGNMYVQNTVYDRFGRMAIQHLADGSVRNEWGYGGAGQNFQLASIAVTKTGETNPLQTFSYGPYDRTGNLLKVTDNTSAYAANSPRDNEWTHTYWGEGRLKSSKRANDATASFNYDYLDNLTSGNLGFPAPGSTQTMSVSTTKPHRMSALSPATPSATPGYHNDGGLKSRPATIAGDLGKTQIDYDALGQVERVVMSDGTEVEYAYDHTSEVVARVVNNSDVTLYYDGLFEVRGGTLTRHFYIEGRRIAFSDTPAPVGLTLAALSDAERATMLARAEAAGGNASGGGRSTIAAGLIGIVAMAGLGLVALLCWAPAPVQLSFFGRVRRVWVSAISLLAIANVVVPPAVLERLALGASPADASCTGPGGATTYPVYFVHPDHLGSASMLTTSRVPAVVNGTPTELNGTVAEYYRYGAYGKPQAYSPNGATIASGSEKTDVLFTGQLWESRTKLYRFPARFYDPQIARFVSLDPAGVGTNPYGYVSWNPVNRVDPTGLADFRYDSCPYGGGFCGVISGDLGIQAFPWFGWAFPDFGPSRGPSFADAVDSTLQAVYGHFESRAALNWSNGGYAGYAVDVVALAILPPDLRTLQFELVLTVVTAGAGKIALSAVRGVRAVRTGLRVASSGVDVAEASIVRTIAHGEKVTDIIEKAKDLTFSTGNEHALISLRSGERVLVSGGPGGIDLSRLPVRRILGHTHPFQALPTGPSLADRAALQTLGQRSSYLFERGRQIRFGAGG